MSKKDKLMKDMMRAFSKYEANKRSQYIKQGITVKKAERIAKLRGKFSELLLEVEYDFILWLVNSYLDTLDERQLAEYVKDAEAHLAAKVIEESIFPPKEWS